MHPSDIANLIAWAMAVAFLVPMGVLLYQLAGRPSQPWKDAKPVSPQEQERLSQWLREETRRLEDETIYHDARIKAEMKRLEFLDVQKLGEKYPPNAGSAR